MPTEVIMERPSGSTAMASSSAGPYVICSGLPLGKRWRQRWLWPATWAAKYIHAPLGDQPADVHAPSGPMFLGAEEPSSEMITQGAQPPFSFICTTSAVLRSGEA